MTKKGGDSEFILRTAQEGTVYHKLYEKNLGTDEQANATIKELLSC